MDAPAIPYPSKVGTLWSRVLVAACVQKRAKNNMFAPSSPESELVELEKLAADAAAAASLAESEAAQADAAADAADAAAIADAAAEESAAEAAEADAQPQTTFGSVAGIGSSWLGSSGLMEGLGRVGSEARFQAPLRTLPSAPALHSRHVSLPQLKSAATDAAGLAKAAASELSEKGAAAGGTRP